MDGRLEKMVKELRRQVHFDSSPRTADEHIRAAFRQIVELCALEVDRHYCSLNPDTSTCYDCGKHLDDPIHLGRTKREPEDLAERIRALFSEDQWTNSKS